MKKSLRRVLGSTMTPLNGMAERSLILQAQLAEVENCVDAATRRVDRC
jgi:hypothetical protein